MMTENQKQALIVRLEKALKAANRGLTHHSYASSLGEGDIVTVYGIALAALTQPAIPALKLPDEMVESGVNGRLYHNEGWNACIAEVKRINAPHTAPIEPICATGGAEWVKVPREPTRQMMSQGHFAMAGTDRGKFRRIYQAMIAAAPEE